MTLPIGPIGSSPVAGGASTSSTGSTTDKGFGKLLEDSLGKLDQAQANADQPAQSLATGNAQDLTSVVMSVEQASLEVQLASQIRNKAVDAYNDIFRMQI
jgi:flagellar hook-basal body complex protein FliE